MSADEHIAFPADPVSYMHKAREAKSVIYIRCKSNL